MLYAVAAVAATGILAGILVAAPRVSPLAAGLPGLLLIGWSALYLYRVQPATDFWLSTGWTTPQRTFAFTAVPLFTAESWL